MTLVHVGRKPAESLASPLSSAERDELIKLRKQLKQVHMERVRRLGR
ncbi:MAG: hypothetical protein ACYC3A_05990 [Halothiobacillus sp.]